LPEGNLIDTRLVGKRIDIFQGGSNCFGEPIDTTILQISVDFAGKFSAIVIIISTLLMCMVVALFAIALGASDGSVNVVGVSLIHLLVLEPSIMNDLFFQKNAHRFIRNK
jgi:hypothetical protein